MNQKAKYLAIAITAILSLSMFIQVATQPVRAEEGESEEFSNDFFDIFGEAGGPDNCLSLAFDTLFQKIWNSTASEKCGTGMYAFQVNGTDANELVDATVDESNSYYTYLPDSYKYNGAPVFVEVKNDKDFTWQLNQTYQLVFILYDHDESLISLLEMLKAAIQDVQQQEDLGVPESEIDYGAMIEVVTYLLFHINDIITGDEALIMSIQYFGQINVTGTASENYTFYSWDQYMDKVLLTNPAANITVDYPVDWAERMIDNPTNNFAGEVVWTRFYFDIWELMLQKLHLSIDLAEIFPSEGEEANPDKALHGIEVMFTLVHHQFLGAWLYQDMGPVPNGLMDLQWENQTVSTPEGNRTIYSPTSNEVRYRVGISNTVGGIGANTYFEPSCNSTQQVDWGMQLGQMNVTLLPYKVEDEPGSSEEDGYVFDYTNAKWAIMQNASFGFSFIPHINVNGTADVEIKVNHEFGALNDTNNDGIPEDLDSTVSQLSLALIYFSFVFRFHMTGNQSWTPTPTQTQTDDETLESGAVSSIRETEQLRWLIGGGDEVDAMVDIAGANYTKAGTGSLDASAAVIPWATWNYEVEANQSEQYNENETVQRTLNLQLDLSAYFYEISYPLYNGCAIVHDPTYTVSIAFTDIVAWLPYITVGALVTIGVVAFVISRRKDRIPDI